jgi:adenosylhomocysteine nucleosidase
MLLRALVSQFVRQAAQRKIYEAAAAALAGQHGASESDGSLQEQEKSSEPVPPCDVVLLFALGIESGGTVDRLSDAVSTRCQSFFEHAGRLDGRRVVVAESGVGVELAARATQDLISLHRPQWVVSAGFAGALHDALHRGHILMANRVADTHNNQLSVGLKLDERIVDSTPSLHVGRLLTVDQIIRDPQDKRRLGVQHDALACDMESMAIADVCRRCKVRFLSVRVISDEVDEHLPPEIESLLNQKNLAGKLGAAAGAIFNRPSSIKDMWKLNEDALKASDRLAKFLLGVVPQLDRGAEAHGVGRDNA